MDRHLGLRLRIAAAVATVGAEGRVALRAAAAEQQAAVGLAAKADVAGAVGVFSAEPTPLQLKDTANRTDENAWPERALRRRGRPKR